MTLHHVAPNGGPGPGTELQPWDLATAETDVLPGDHVIIDGQYNQYFRPKVSGALGNPITYRAKSPAVHFSGAGLGVGWLKGVFEIVNVNHITTIGLGFKNSNYGGISVRGYCEGIEIWDTYFENCPVGVWATSTPEYGNQYGSVKNLKVSGTLCRTGGSAAVYLSGVDQFDIGYTDVDSMNGYAVVVRDGASNGNIHHSIVTNCKGGVSVACGASVINGIVIDSNFINMCVESGIFLNPTDGAINNSSLINNVSCKNVHNGLHLGNLGLRDGLKVINNTFALNGGQSIQCPEDNIELLKNIQINNNIVQGQWWFPLISQFANSCRNNLFTGTTFGVDYMVGDPMFNDPAGNDYTLKPGSLAEGTGDPEGAPATDINGYPREETDIGAYEDGSQPATLPPSPPSIPGGDPPVVDPPPNGDDPPVGPPPSDGGSSISLPLVAGGAVAVGVGMLVFAKKRRK